MQTSRTEEKRKAQSYLVWKPDEKRPMERTRHNGPKQIGQKGVDWIHVAWDREMWLAVVNMVMTSQVQ